ncbi:Wiskott-Aldrich syndrome protein [Geosmithia morbida]|uniref:Wiskott-Aldrich syndrome protein n=1 Tax=Geosmithia morbida TaxID=1094350 RepID=A0A9P5D676_9HYPO|nr:Wiskott-Aldrich syndrome protein [Geosmithia morbida]KAF4124490.1 Wiskott-Aldrich syndrome protein [Geosmithia morbida]
MTATVVIVSQSSAPRLGGLARPTVMEYHLVTVDSVGGGNKDRSSLGSEASTPGLIDDKTDSEVSGDEDYQYHAHTAQLWDSFWRPDDQKRGHDVDPAKKDMCGGIGSGRTDSPAKSAGDRHGLTVAVKVDGGAGQALAHPRKQYPALIPSPQQHQRHRAQTDITPHRPAAAERPSSRSSGNGSSSSSSSSSSPPSSRARLPAANYPPFPKPLAIPTARKPITPSWESSRPQPPQKPPRPPRPDERLLLSPCLKQHEPSSSSSSSSNMTSTHLSSHVADLLITSPLSERYMGYRHGQTLESEEQVQEQLHSHIQMQRQKEHEQRMRAQRKAQKEQQDRQDRRDVGQQLRQEKILLEQHHREMKTQLRQKKSKPSLADYIPPPPPPPPCSDKPDRNLRSMKSAASIRPVQVSGEMARPKTSHGGDGDGGGGGGGGHPRPDTAESQPSSKAQHQHHQSSSAGSNGNGSGGSAAAALLLRRPKSSKTLCRLDSIEMKHQQYRQQHRPKTQQHCAGITPSPEPQSVFEDDSDDDGGGRSFFRFHKRATSDVRRVSRQHSQPDIDLRGRRRGLTTPSPTRGLMAPGPGAGSSATTTNSTADKKRSGADVFGRMLGRRSR